VKLSPKSCRIVHLLALVASASTLGLGAVREIDRQRSVVTVRVNKAGLFSAFGHDHEIRAPIQGGSLDEEKRAVEFTIDSRTLRVVDPGASEGDRSQIQQTMLGPKVLDCEQFPQIKFHSIAVESSGANRWRVAGELMLHGQTHAVKVEANGGDGQYRGSTKLRQTEFGITPVSIAGGSIKVKDDIWIEFEIVGK
jgi:polyisoprenoid-binding protein YceI